MTKNGFDPELHKRILIEILVDIFKELDGKLAFKGGTCGFIFYNLPRLSLDLDFDILKPLTEKDIDSLKIILERRGKIKDFRDKNFTVFFLLDYQINAPNIKIELNKRVLQNNRYKSVWFLGVEMLIVDEATILTNKMIALTNRKQIVSRDLFDVYYFLELGFPVNEELIRERVNKELRDYFIFLQSFIKNNYSAKNILQGLGELLSQKQKEWAKKELISETIKAIEKINNKQ